MAENFIKEILRTLESIDKSLRRIERYTRSDTIEDNSIDDEDVEGDEADYEHSKKCKSRL